MCGRYSLITNPESGQQYWVDLYDGEIKLNPYGLGALFHPRFNIAPTQEAPIIRMIDGQLRMDFARWGLIPGWMHDPKKAPLLINARADTVAEKPSFRSALKLRRCLVPADGFYEWAPPPEGAPKSAKKQPWWFRRADAHVFAMAGLWEPPNELAPHGSYTLITTEPNEVVSRVHDRMPVILPREAYALWLDPAVKDPAAVLPLLRPYPAEGLTSRAVSQRLNSARAVDDASLVEPDPPPPEDLRLF